MRKIVLIAISALVILGLAGGSLTYAALSKTVTLSIDGEVQEVRTFGDSVEEVLDGEGIEIKDHDAVAPSLSTEVDDGSRIAVRFGRQLALTVDGEETTYWVTATSVSEALSQIGRSFSRADMSASRSAEIGRQGLDLVVKTAKDVKLTYEGKTKKVTTTGLTVREALKDLKVKYDGNDEVTPRLKSTISDGTKISVVRIRNVTKTVNETYYADTIVRHDSDMYEDEEKVVREGRAGLKKVTYRIVLADGKERNRTAVESKVLREPVAKIEVHGTKERPEPEPNYAGGGTVWDALAECESGGNWAINTGNGYYGGLQFSLSTWQSYGGTGYPHEHSRETQIMIAERVRAATGGYGSWPACAASLGLPT